ncbi:MAG: hypothetical protein IPG97_13160 [Microthrixaceae bacterium]|nr:hypothetical protein [Microthrixaceae bacterium]
MPDIKFTLVNEIPKPKRFINPGGKYVPLFEHLRANPGAVVKIDKHHPTLASRIKRGEMSGCEAGEFFATCRNVKDGKADIYVTYVGPKPNEDFHERTVAL